LDAITSFIGNRLNKSKLIIWDWNGTLINDIDACISSMNTMLKKRKMKIINYSIYRKLFKFPVENYYKSLGFNFKREPFEKLAIEYIDLYKERSKKANLQIGSIKALDYIKIMGYTQIIISAMEQNTLEEQIEQNISINYFESIIGLNNIHANSKISNAIKYLIKRKKNKLEEIILIGDTFHDYEVANTLGCKCILLGNGHQDLSRFKLNGNINMINNLLDINETLL